MSGSTQICQQMQCIASWITFSLDLFIRESLLCENISKLSFFKHFKAWFLMLDWENETSIGFFFSANIYCIKVIANKPQSTHPVCCCTGMTATVINFLWQYINAQICNFV